MLPDGSLGHARHYPSLSCLTLELVSRHMLLHRVEAANLSIPSASSEQADAALPQGEGR